MAKYFTIVHGLRGCYMPDGDPYDFAIVHGLRGCYMPDGDPYVVMVHTRRELKAMIQDEANNLDSGETLGLSKRAIARFAANCWYEAHKTNPAYLPHCLPIKEKGQSSYSCGIFVSVASRREYLDQPQDD